MHPLKIILSYTHLEVLQVEVSVGPRHILKLRSELGALGREAVNLKRRRRKQYIYGVYM